TLFQSQHILSGSIWTLFQVIIVLTAGTMFLMWLGEQITEHGIGNGVSIVIFAGIMASLPVQIERTATFVKLEHAYFALAVLLLSFLATIVAIVTIETAQ